jgi:hypothetical protein
VSNWIAGADGDLAQWQFALGEELSGLREEVCHDALSIGKFFPFCQGAHSRGSGKQFRMGIRPLPKTTLARNLRMLLQASGRSSPEIAKEAGVVAFDDCTDP